MLGALLGSDEVSLSGCFGCDAVFPGGAREGDRDELSFDRRLPNPFLIARIVKVEYEMKILSMTITTYHPEHEVACELCARLVDKNTWGIGRTCHLPVILDTRISAV